MEKIQTNKSFAKLIAKATLLDDTAIKLSNNGKTYPVSSFSLKFKNLIKSKTIEFNKEFYYICAPNTRNKSGISYEKESKVQVPYLSFKIVDFIPEENKKTLNENLLEKVLINGIITYENIKYEFFLVKVFKDNSSETLKIRGVFNETDRTKTTGKFFQLAAEIKDNSLHLLEYRILEDETENSSHQQQGQKVSFQ